MRSNRLSYSPAWSAWTVASRPAGPIHLAFGRSGAPGPDGPGGGLGPPDPHRRPRWRRRSVTNRTTRPPLARAAASAAGRSPVDPGQRGGIGGGAGPGPVDHLDAEAGHGQRPRPCATRITSATRGSTWPRVAEPRPRRDLVVTPWRPPPPTRVGQGVGKAGRRTPASGGDGWLLLSLQHGRHRGNGLVAAEVHDPHTGGVAALRRDLADRHADDRAARAR